MSVHFATLVYTIELFVLAVCRVRLFIPNRFECV